jgi:hypothetical protein
MSSIALRLARAAELAFPDGGMTASGLRKEAAKGRGIAVDEASRGRAHGAAIFHILRGCVNFLINLCCERKFWANNFFLCWVIRRRGTAKRCTQGRLGDAG